MPFKLEDYHKLNPVRESDVLTSVKDIAERLGCKLWRNTSGAYQTKSGHWIRYGLANPGGSDLIGIMPVTITADMVGKQLGVFVALECKRPKGSKTTDHQLNFIEQVKALHGMAGTAKTADDAVVILRASASAKPSESCPHR